MLVLVVLTYYFSVLDSQEKAEARNLLGQDRLSAICDPIAAMRKPVDRRYLDASKYPMARVMTSAAILSTTAIFIRHLSQAYQVPSLVLAFWRDAFVAAGLLLSQFFQTGKRQHTQSLAGHIFYSCVK